MGLISNLLIAVIHLVFVAMDIITVMILITIIYGRWRTETLNLIVNAITPVVNVIASKTGTIVRKISGRSFQSKELLTMTLVIMLLMRLILSSIIS